MIVLQCRNVPSHYMLIVFGDMNGKVGIKNEKFGVAWVKKAWEKGLKMDNIFRLMWGG